MYFTCPRCTQVTNIDTAGAEYDGYGWPLACGCGRMLVEFEQTCEEDFEPKDVPEEAPDD